MECSPAVEGGEDDQNLAGRGRPRCAGRRRATVVLRRTSGDRERRNEFVSARGCSWRSRLLQRRSTAANRAAAGDELGGLVSRRAAVRRLRGGAAGRGAGLQGAGRRAQEAAASYLWGRARRRRRRPGLLAWHAMAMAPGLDRVWLAWLPGRSGPGWAAGTGQEVGRLDGFDGLRKKLEGV
jgi:hypothetical protein